MASKTLKLTLTIDKSTNRVVFAEADKDFVDILFSFLTLPLATIVGLTNNTTFPCLNNLYKSVKDLGNEYFKLNSVGKNMLLTPSHDAEMECLDLAVNLEGDRALTYYTCHDKHCSGNWSPYLNTKCGCGDLMNRKVKIVREKGKEDGVFLKGVKMFIISDDFVIKQATTKAAMMLIGSVCVSNLEERNVTVRQSEVLALLQMALASNTALTDTFIARGIDNTSSMLKKQFDNLTLKTNPNPISEKPDNKSNISIKIVIDIHERKVLYAEGNQHFADLLFSFLTYPSGSVIKSLNKNSDVTCVDNLYASALDPSIAESFKFYYSKEYLVNPKIPSFLKYNKSFIKFGEIVQDRYYMCRNPECESTEVSNIPNAPCKCKCITNKRMKLFNPYGIEGFVNEATYIVTDDLSVTPLRSISFITRLIANAKEGTEEVIRNIGEKEMLLLLEAALDSETALTDVLLNYEEAIEASLEK